MSSDPDFGSQLDFYTFAPETLGKELPEYEILREVGKGSMGIVYEARRRSDGERVALKILPPSLTLTERALARFVREGRLMAKVEHPAIVRCFDQGRQGRLHYFVMEFVPGVTLEQRLKVGPLPVRQACEISAAVAHALQFAHDHGVVHRDIKPGNVMLRESTTPDGTDVAITDFGLARETGTGSMTESGAIVGTPMYMAPEAVLGGSARADTRADVYSLGATLYALVTGRPPFLGPTAQSVLKAVLERDPPLPRRLRTDLPAGVEAIVLKAMDRQPPRRYGSAQEMAEDLERFLAGERVQARRPGPVLRLWRVAARRPLLTTLFALVALLAVGAWSLTVESQKRAVQAGIAEAESHLALASTRSDEHQRLRTPAERRDLLLEAVSAASDVIATDSGSALAWFVRAKAYHQLRDYESALRDLDQAELLLGEALPEILHYRIDALHGLGGGRAAARMLEDLTCLLELDPGRRTSLTLVAGHLLDVVPDLMDPEMRKSALETAANALQSVVAGDSPRAAVARARLLEQRGDADGAIAAIRKARVDYEGEPVVHHAAARMFSRLGLLAEGQDAATVARILDPERAPEPAAPALDMDGFGGFLNRVNDLLEALDGKGQGRE